ncbi:hypothetical protein ACE6H2_017614 [Prunus campanulata]
MITCGFCIPRGYSTNVRPFSAPHVHWNRAAAAAEDVFFNQAAETTQSGVLIVWFRVHGLVLVGLLMGRSSCLMKNVLKINGLAAANTPLVTTYDYDDWQNVFYTIPNNFVRKQTNLLPTIDKEIQTKARACDMYRNREDSYDQILRKRRENINGNYEIENINTKLRMTQLTITTEKVFNFGEEERRKRKEICLSLNSNHGLTIN